jgi:hypothetical protein
VKSVQDAWMYVEISYNNLDSFDAKERFKGKVLREMSGKLFV